MKKLKVILPVVIAGAILIFAGCSEHVAEGNGRRGSSGETVAAGRGKAAAEALPESRQIDEEDAQPVTPVSLIRLEGTLAFDDPEWYLDTGDEIVLLHLGNRSYLESLEIDLVEGSDAIVFGIMEEDGLSVVRIVTDNGELALRDDSGAPLWAGKGQGRGSGSGRGGGQGAGRGSGGGTGNRGAQTQGADPIAL